MGNVVDLFPPSSSSGRARPDEDMRATEAGLLRQAIASSRAASLRPGDAEKVAGRVDGFIGRHGAAHGHGSISALCALIWPGGDGNPARRRRELRTMTKPATLAKYIDRIAEATGGSADDMLLEAFRGTRLDDDVQARLRGIGVEPELEVFWSELSGTLHALAAAVSRAEGLGAHLERMLALRGLYNLATDAVRPAPNRLVRGALANDFEIFEDYPPIPSVPLFAEAKSATVLRDLTLRDTGEAVPVQVTILREVRLAIGPVDDPLVPGPLFEFRSVLELRTLEGKPLRVRCPWLFLETSEFVEAEIDGAWRAADLDLATPEDAPRAGLWRFPAPLEEPIQPEHSYVAWRPVTPATCRELLLRSPGDGAFERPHWQGVETFCPPGTWGEAVEAALHDGGPDGLPERLRAEAKRMATLLRAWHAGQAGAASAAHRALHDRWEGWS